MTHVEDRRNPFVPGGPTRPTAAVALALGAVAWVPLVALAGLLATSRSRSAFYDHRFRWSAVWVLGATANALGALWTALWLLTGLI